MQKTKQKKVMKMQLLIGSLMIMLISCKDDLKNDISLDSNYKFISVTYFKEKKYNLNWNETVKSLKNAKQIKGPLKSIIIKEIKILRISKKDTISIIVYGYDNKFFKFNNQYYESETPVLPLGIWSEPKWMKRNMISKYPTAQICHNS